MLSVPSHLLDALAWTLIHSVWQGVIAALTYRVCRSATRAAAVRHAVGHLCLTLFLLCQAITFISVLGSGQTLSDALTNVLPPNEMPLLHGLSMFRPMPSSAASPWVLAMQPLLPWLAGLWLAGLTSQLAWMLVLMTSLRREISRCTEVTEPLRARLTVLTTRIRGVANVRFLETTSISVPGTAGWLQPIVLVPAGWALQMPPQQVEAIILHELAHVARRDYLASLLRSFVRSAYFFHFPLRWTIHALEGDAEQAADDMAADALGDAHAYASALLELEVRRSPVQLLLGADGGSLQERFRHLIEAQRTHAAPFGRVIGTMTAGFLAIVLLGYGVAGAASGRAQSEWLSSRSLTDAVIEILSVEKTNPRADALIDELRALPTPPREKLIQLAAELQRGFSGEHFLKEVTAASPALPLSKLELPIYGTSLERRRLVDAMVALSQQTTGDEQRDVARAAVLLAAIDLFDRNGIRGPMLIKDPALRAKLGLSPAATARLELVASAHNRVTGEALPLVIRAGNTAALDEDSLRKLIESLPRLPGVRRSILSGRNAALREQILRETQDD